MGKYINIWNRKVLAQYLSVERLPAHVSYLIVMLEATLNYEVYGLMGISGINSILSK